MTHTIIRGLSKEKKSKFKIKCLESGHTMQSALEFLVEEVISSRICLPTKE